MSTDNSCTCDSRPHVVGCPATFAWPQHTMKDTIAQRDSVEFGRLQREHNLPTYDWQTDFIDKVSEESYERARLDLAKEVAMAGENKIPLLNDTKNFTGTHWISLNMLYFYLTGRHINADWESGALEKNPSIEAFIREEAARTTL